MILLLVLLQDGASIEGELIRNENPDLQIRLPKEYKLLDKKGMPPDIYDQFPYRYWRKAGCRFGPARKSRPRERPQSAVRSRSSTTRGGR